MDNSNNEILKNSLAVVAGVIVSSVIFMFAGLIFLLTQFSQVKGHDEETDFTKMSNRFLLFMILLVALCGFIGSYITTRMSTKRDWAHGMITGFVLAGLLAYISEFNIEREAIIYYVAVIGAALSGTSLAIRWKKKRELN
jgi:putative membrane protein (TIGR04086 family)